MEENDQNSLGSISLGSALSDITQKNSIFADQLLNLNKFEYKPLLTEAIENRISAFNELGSLEVKLPKFDAGSLPFLDSARKATLSLSEFANSEGVLKIQELSKNVVPWFNEAVVASQRLTDSIQPFIDRNKALLSSINSIVEPLQLAQFSIQTNIAKISELSVFAENSLTNIGAQDLGAQINLNDPLKADLHNSFVGLSEGYQSLLSSFGKNFGFFANFSPQLTRLTSEEYFNDANLIEAISIDTDEESSEQIRKNSVLIDNERSLSFYLPTVNNDLVNLWAGVKGALQSNNPDRVRHFGTSIRELFTHVLNALAPDDEIKSWTSRTDYYHNGRPTRAARLKYISRNINSGAFEDFVEKDIASFTTFMDIFQDTTHSVRSNFTEKQLLAMQCRAESTIKYLIVIGKN